MVATAPPQRRLKPPNASAWFWRTAFAAASAPAHRERICRASRLEPYAKYITRSIHLLLFGSSRGWVGWEGRVHAAAGAASVSSVLGALASAGVRSRRPRFQAADPARRLVRHRRVVLNSSPMRPSLRRTTRKSYLAE